MPDFTHLHVHTQYSILDGASRIPDLLKKVKDSGMDTLAITDHGNMFGALKFFLEAKKAGVKPIMGCEIYIAEGSRFEKKGRQGRSSYHLILLAKNKTGYRNLSRLSSLGYLEGFYYTPRIDKEILKKYSEGLIATSACLGGEVPSAIRNKGIEEGERVLKEYLDIFGEDFYLELQRHGWPDQDQVNPELMALAEKYKVPLIAANDVHYVNKEDFDAHKILICLNTGKDLDDTGGLHYSGEEYLKTPEEMEKLFEDIPEALLNTRKIAEKVEEFDILEKNIILPDFPLPEGFETQDEYLRHLTYKGAEVLYGETGGEVEQRLDFELKVIADMGFAGYFLIVQDFINEARKMDVIVGPGRGSAAGSAVAFCTGITSIDPIKYNLLFERFLNPERVSMPDIDVDFDDEGRDRVLQYVVNKYGESRVAQIVTFGTMAARLAIRDVARVLKLPLPEADRIAKLVPETPGITLKEAYKSVKDLKAIKAGGEELARKTLTYAEILEGSARHTGTHACGVIIGPDDLINHVPLSTAKDSDLMVTQFEGKLVELAGMLKMDFLGLKTLSIIKSCIKNIEDRHNKKIDIESIPLDDKKTFMLYQRGDTIGTFQFESDGMRNHLRDLKPNNIEDLIAMNALYRPGPMEFIPMYIRRKHGKEKVAYPHALLEDILKPTYGIMVYQEQIMKTAQILGGFSLGKADMLRRAMGKKQMDVMEKQMVDFIEGAAQKDISREKAEEVFEIMKEFAKYGFNRSHSAAYSVVAYRTGYLKANYTAEYMAAVLTHNLSDIKKITQFIDACQHQGIEVLGPDINESEVNFTVNEQGQIRFGMAAIKGVGEAAVHEIITERKANGRYLSIFDLAKRSNLRALNRRSLEALAMAGTFDGFTSTHRAQYFYTAENEEGNFLEKIVKHAAGYQERMNSSQVSLFGDSDQLEIKDPEMPACDPWSRLQQLNFEKDVTGFYISGHPLDDYAFEISEFATTEIQSLKGGLQKFKNKEIKFGGLINDAANRTTKTGKPFGTFVLEDFTDSISLSIFAEEYLKFKHFLVPGSFVFIVARVVPAYHREDQLNIRIQQMYLLADTVDKFTSSVEVKIPANLINQEFTAEFLEILKRKKGIHPLKFVVFDPDGENMNVSMPSKKYKVYAPDFVRAIKDYRGVTFHLK